MSSFVSIGIFYLFFVLKLSIIKVKISAGPAADKPCIPFVSQYSDCSDANQCIGCTRCTCSAEAKWACVKVNECPKKRVPITENMVDKVFSSLLYEIQNKKDSATDKDNFNVHEEREKDKQSEDVLLDAVKPFDQQIVSYLRKKREALLDDVKTIGSRNRTEGIKFYHALDEINEDTLPNMNTSGTIEAKKVDIDQIFSRRTDILAHNSSGHNIQMDYNTLQNIDNKLDANHSDSIDLIGQAKIGIMTNHTQQERDRDLSKIVVNELKLGTEIIGDKSAPVMSNITFTPENDTLTAMAFIAGNLLNKLWSMEKDSSDESMEIEALKTEKIKDLLDLFKEPLTMRQESFLKSALETLSKVIEKHQDTKNISLCDSINNAKKFIEEAGNMTWERSEIVVPDLESRKNADQITLSTESPNETKNNATKKAISKLNHVMNLIKKYEAVTKHLIDLKKPKNKNTKGKINSNEKSKKAENNRLRSGPDEENIADDEKMSINMFGKVLEKITKLMMPNKKGNKMSHKIRNFHIFDLKDEDAKEKLKQAFHVEIGNLTVKDKMILDYLAKVKYNPTTLLADPASNEVPSSYLEGDILLNLSEFFKIKSMVDLLNHLDGDNTYYSNNILRSDNSLPTTECPTCKLNLEGKLDPEHHSDSEDHKEHTDNAMTKPISKIKDKLKIHLKTILDDLMELQKESGVPKKDGELASSVVDAFPCIYNILKNDEITNSTLFGNKTIDPYVKIADVFKALKNEFKTKSSLVVNGRRMDESEAASLLKNTPQSTLIWERVIGNIDESLKSTARRNSDIKTPSTFEELRTKIEDVDATTRINDYKSFDKIAAVPAADQRMLLMALHADVQHHLSVLKDIKVSYDLLETLSSEKLEVIKDFIDDAAFVLGADKNAVEAYNKIKKIRAPVIQTTTELQVELIPKSSNLLSRDPEPKSFDKNIKLTRDEVLNQLIKNRVSHYLTMMQSRNDNFKNDPNFGIANSIMTNLEHGNVKLARQLYKIFVTSKQGNSVNAVNEKNKERSTDKLQDSKIRDKFHEKLAASFTDKLNEKFSYEKANKGSQRFAEKIVPMPPIFPDAISPRRQVMLDKEPIVHFEEPNALTNQLLAARRDQMVRNLLNSKSFKVM